jgi:hypothetical protein
MTVSELIAQLCAYPADLPVRTAATYGHADTHEIVRVWLHEQDSDGQGEETVFLDLEQGRAQVP